MHVAETKNLLASRSKRIFLENNNTICKKEHHLQSIPSILSNSRVFRGFLMISKHQQHSGVPARAHIPEFKASLGTGCNAEMGTVDANVKHDPFTADFRALRHFYVLDDPASAS
jgi:hypothetical protein